MASIVDAAAAAISSKETSSEEVLIKKKPTVVFVLGGPGGGKTTQCTKLAKEIGYTNLSTGELLRKAIELDPENRHMIESMLVEGSSVPADYTMKTILKAMENSKNDKFLLDGFPRDEEIRAAFEATLNIEPELVLFFDCSEEERERRILSRNQGRKDDNPKSLRKRFKYFEEHTLPIIEYYNSRGKVTKIDAGKPMEEIFVIVKSYLTSLKIPSENVTEAKAEAVIEVESKTSGKAEVSALAEAVTDVVVIETVTEDESKSSSQSEVLNLTSPNVPSENVTEAKAEAVIEVESKTSGKAEVSALAEAVTDVVVIETVTEDESKSSSQSEVLDVAEDVTPGAEAQDKAVAKVEVSEPEVEAPSKFDLERDIMKMKL